jgi:hypothetical protein
VTGDVEEQKHAHENQGRLAHHHCALVDQMADQNFSHLHACIIEELK